MKKIKKSATYYLTEEEIKMIVDLLVYLSGKHGKLLNKSEVVAIAVKFALEHKDTLKI